MCSYNIFLNFELILSALFCNSIKPSSYVLNVDLTLTADSMTSSNLFLQACRASFVSMISSILYSFLNHLNSVHFEFNYSLWNHPLKWHASYNILYIQMTFCSISFPVVLLNNKLYKHYFRMRISSDRTTKSSSHWLHLKRVLTWSILNILFYIRKRNVFFF